MGSGVENIERATPDVAGQDVTHRFTAGAAHVDASPIPQAVTQDDATADPNGPFVGMRFDAAGTVILIGGDGVSHTLTVLAGEYFPGTILRIDDTSTTLADAEMIGFKRA